MASAEKLHALTSLRFFAALAIVFHHIQGGLGVAEGFARPFLLEQGVSFFFVLSGFILSHVHGQLADGKAPRFLWARFARVWPAHIAAIVLLVVLHGWPDRPPLPTTLPAALANAGLLHAWFPWPSYFFSLNNVSWTLSVEAFFYATFPVVTRRIDRRWPFWLALSLAAAYAMTVVASHYAVSGPEPNSPTIDSFVNINPLARWFEFVLGICTALAWRRLQPRLQFGIVAGSALELLALGVLGVAGYYSAQLAANLSQNTAQFLWLAHGPVAAPAFAFLIAVMACGRGAVSQWLARPFPVRLGEISYALYLVHYPFLVLAWSKYPAAAAGPGLILLLAQILLASHLLWQCVETPARRALTRLYPMSENAASIALFPRAERRVLLLSAIAHTLALVALFAGQKILEAG